MTHQIILILLLSSPLCWAGKIYESEGMKFTVKTLIEREDVIWGFDFLPDNSIVFTERSGNLLLWNVETNKTSQISGVPKVHEEGQGGLLDVRVHPDFKKNNLIYLSYSEAVGDKATTAIAVAELKTDKLENLKKIFSAHQPNKNDIHFGSRIEFDDKDFIYFSVGDRNDRKRAQDLSFHMGKIMRLHADGTTPKDNPFNGKEGAKAEIFSYGHRNPQGLVWHSGRKELWEVEFGPRGGDEVNLIEAGKNYGWPVITYGREYYGPRIGSTHKPGMEQPLINWTPSISPSGATFYFADAFPKWKGNLFLANLASQHIRRIELTETKPIKQEELLKDLDYRFRHIRSGPEGHVYFSTDSGVLGKIVPVK